MNNIYIYYNFDRQNSQLKKIEKVLPCTYNEDTIIDLLKKHYPHEWKSVEYKKQYYDQKDKYLIKRFGKARYKMPFAEELIRNNVKLNIYFLIRQKEIIAVALMRIFGKRIKKPCGEKEKIK